MRFPRALASILLAGAMALPHARCQDAPPAAADPEGIVATKSVIVGVSGPRGGEQPARYFNVQGSASRADKKYSSFGVIEFPAGERLADALRVEGDGPTVTLVLTQSIPPFARPGRVTVMLAAGSEPNVATLRFLDGEDGLLGAAAESCVRCGEWDFVAGATGCEDRIAIDFPEGARKALLAEDADRTVRLIVLPDDPGVAATWFGTDQAIAGHRPRLVID